MRCVVQRVSSSSVKVDGKVVGSIDLGLNVLVGFTQTDTIKEIEYCVKKILNLRVFDDEQGIMNKSVLDVNGSILSISQFTLYGDVKKGNRPSYIKALGGEKALPLYEKFNELLRSQIKVETGVFGADMKVSINNDGPCTIIIDTDYR